MSSEKDPLLEVIIHDSAASGATTGGTTTSSTTNNDNCLTAFFKLPFESDGQCGRVGNIIKFSGIILLLASFSMALAALIYFTVTNNDSSHTHGNGLDFNGTTEPSSLPSPM